MEVIDFRFLTTDSRYDLKYKYWSRIYEYPFVIDTLKNLGANETSCIHNTSWGFADVHEIFKNDIDSIFPNSIHSDIRPSTLPKTMVYDITKPIEKKYEEFFDFVINVSTIEEVNCNNIQIINNLFNQVKDGGYLIITFDYIPNKLTKDGDGSINLSLIQQMVEKQISPLSPKSITGENSAAPQPIWSHLRCGILIIKKLNEHHTSSVKPNIMQKGDMKNHLIQIIDKINKKIPFGIIRPGDGEYSVICNKTITTGDNWTFKSNGTLQKDLSDALAKQIENLYIGIPCNTCCNKHVIAGCSKHMSIFLKDQFKIPLSRMTYANIFCNGNWEDFILFLHNYTAGFYLITSGQQFCDFPIKQRILIDPLLVDKWDTQKENITIQLIHLFKDKKGELICFSAGPLSKIWIPMLIELYPDNIYLDIGSSFDIFSKGNTNRLYIGKHSPLGNHICNFNYQELSQ